jgi:eukaryotic-like serine/threonine-protein kinase
LVPVPAYLKSLDLPELQALWPEIGVVRSVKSGGQKVVYEVEAAGERWALKMIPIGAFSPVAGTDSAQDWLEEAAQRARREVEIMDACASPNIVSLGPFPLQLATVKGHRICVFSEEWIDGEDGVQILQSSGPLSARELKRLSLNAISAIQVLWANGKVHRDIKPNNIMRRKTTGEYVLLDLGLAFDTQDVSLSGYGSLHGTIPFYSPEQTDFRIRRQLDFRSDLFSLGTTLYCLATGGHPFWHAGMSDCDCLRNIVNLNPPPPISVTPSVPQETSDFICRLLQKEPHLRFRNCALALDEAGGLPE